MKPLSSVSFKAARSVRVVLTDIDDTVTTEGVLTAKAYGALEDQCQKQRDRLKRDRLI